MLADIEIDVFLNWHNFDNKKSISIELEGSVEIDDLIINLDNNEKVYSQIKRKVSLSESKESDFVKTMDQFIRAYLRNIDNEKYLLITPSFSSSKIIRDLKKILESIRLNPTGFQNNPLTASEKDTYAKFKKVIKKLYKKYTKVTMNDSEFIKFSHKVFISIFDIEDNSTIEYAVLTLLTPLVNTKPSLLWGKLISNCLTYATNRQSINKEYLTNSFSQFLKKTNNEIIIKDENFLKPILKESFASGKEVILVENNNFIDNLSDADLLLIELNRFDDNCIKELEFDSDTCKMLKSNVTFNVLYRTSTFKGMERLIENNLSIVNNQNITVIPANSLDNIELTDCSRTYSEKSSSNLSKKNNVLSCLVCGKSISSNQSLIVEIDQLDMENDIGLMHESCLKPCYRILGKIESDLFTDYDVLKNFNWNLWFKQVIRGQILFNDHLANSAKENKVMFWNSEVDYINEYSYCIKEEIEDGSVEYVTIRGKIERFQKNKAEEAVKNFNEHLIELEQNNDYLCLLKSTRATSTYSYLKDKVDISDELLKIKNYVVEKINPTIIMAYEDNENFYAPLIYITQGENQEYFTIDNRVVFINDPLLLNNYITNWKKIGIEVDINYDVKIVKDDIEFDNLMHKIYRDGLNAMFNPNFNSECELINGMVLERLI
jgi:hypothetical protein